MKSLEELAALRERMKNNVAMRQDNSTATRVVVGMATCGIAAGARPVLTAFVEEVNRRGLKDVVVTQAGCIGMCKLEPIVEVFQPGKEKVTYVKMTPEKVSRIVTEHLGKRQPGDRVHRGRLHGIRRTKTNGDSKNTHPGVRRYRLQLLPFPGTH